MPVVKRDYPSLKLCLLTWRQSPCRRGDMEAGTVNSDRMMSELWLWERELRSKLKWNDMTRNDIICFPFYHGDAIKWKHFRVIGPFFNGVFRSQRPVTRNFDVFFDLRLNNRLSRLSRRRWFETQTRSLWGHFNVRPWERESRSKL